MREREIHPCPSALAGRIGPAAQHLPLPLSSSPSSSVQPTEGARPSPSPPDLLAAPRRHIAEGIRMSPLGLVDNPRDLSPPPAPLPRFSISPEHHHRRRSPLTRPPCSPRLAEESNSSACFLYSISDQGFELGATTAPESSSSAPTVAGAPPPIADALLLLSHHRGLRVPPR